MKILDISHYQQKIDWTRISDPVILKCTESVDYIDPTFKNRQKLLRDKNLYLGCYHFFRDVDPIKQADFFLAHADYKKGEILVLDFEINCENVVQKCWIFLNEVKKRTGQIGYLYTNEARKLKYDWPSDWNYWIAKYGTNSGKMQTPPKGTWKIWQFTSRGKVDGIEGNVDLNYANDLNIYAKPEIPMQKPGIQKYSQNDPRWSNDKLGNSNCTLGKFGCTTSAICTLASYFGETLTPKDLASHKELYTFNGLILWPQLDHILKNLKFLIRCRFFSEEMIDDALIKDPNKCVLANVDRGFHWVSLLKKTNLGYTASDPYPCPSVNRNYKNKDIEGFAILVKK